LHIFAAAEKIDAQHALQFGLVDQVVKKPLREALRLAQDRHRRT
jgi:enoyl-CoA hydratase/carnithine racemase